MQYISIAQMAQKWQVTPRRVQDWCRNGAIPGGTRFGRVWMVPENALKPLDGRTKFAQAQRLPDDGLPHLPMPRKNPYLIYTDLYQTPGTSDAAVAALADQPEAARILRAQFNYQQGNIDMIYQETQYFLAAHSGFNAVISAGGLLARCATWRGDLHLWHQARQHIYEAPCKDESEQQALAFWLAVVDSSLNDLHEFPDWFKRGIFDLLPADSYPAARVFYVKYLTVAAHELAAGNIELPDVDGLGLMRTLPHIIEPMVSQARIERTLLPEIILRLIAAVVYHNLGRNELAIPHLDKAIEYCLPDKLYATLAEYRRPLDRLMDERLALQSEDALRRLRELHGQMNTGWIKLHNLVLDRSVSTALTVREREVAKLAVFGLSNSQIAQRLHIEISSVKRYIFSAMNKCGAQKRGELRFYI